MNHEDDLKSKLLLWKSLGPKKKFQRNSILMVINEHMRYLLIKSYPIQSSTELNNSLIEITNVLLSSLVELNALEKVTHNDLKGLKTLFSFTRTLHALPFVTHNTILTGLFESITNEVVQLSEKFKQVLTYWNKNILAAEFTQNMKSNHVIKEDNSNKDVNGKESNGVDKDTSGDKNNKSDMNAKQRKNLQRKDKSAEKKDKKVKANPEEISAKAKKSQKNFKRKMDLLNKKKKK